MNKVFPQVSLAEIVKPISRSVEIVPGQSYRTIGVRWWGEGAYERQTIDGSRTAAKTLSLVRQGDLIINKIWVRHGSTAIAGDDVDGCVASGEFPTFTLDEKRVAPRWLHWYTKTRGFWAKCDVLSQGTSGKNRIKPELFLTIHVPLPPLAEQRRVVATIEELSAQINEARTLRHQATEEAEALLLSTSANYFIPKADWQIKAVGDFCESPQYGYTESSTIEAIGPRFLRITDIQNNCVDWESVPYCRCPEPEKYLLKPDDLVFARTGATTGKSFVIRECPEAVFASYLIRLRVKNTVSIDYLYRYFQSPDYWLQIADEKTGTGQPNLNGSKLAQLKVPIAPLSGQRRIVAELDALQAQVDALKRQQAETAAELDALLPAILDRAFKGELVPQESIPVYTKSRPAIAAQKYFIQLLPALLREINRPLTLRQLNATTSLLFLPDQLIPLIESTAGKQAAEHFKTFSQPSEDGAFKAALNLLINAGTITSSRHAVGDSAILKLGSSRPPPISAEITTDARYLAAIIDLVPENILPSGIDARKRQLKLQSSKI